MPERFNPEHHQLPDNVNKVGKLASEELEADIYLFGSRARGDNGSASDWDLLAVVPRPITFVQELDYLAHLRENNLSVSETSTHLTFIYRGAWENPDTLEDTEVRSMIKDIKRHAVKLFSST